MSEQGKPDDIFAPIEDDGWNTDEKCPWCGKYIDEAYHYADSDTFDCPHCEKPVDCETWTQFIMKRGRYSRELHVAIGEGRPGGRQQGCLPVSGAAITTSVISLSGRIGGGGIRHHRQDERSRCQRRQPRPAPRTSTTESSTVRSRHWSVHKWGSWTRGQWNGGWGYRRVCRRCGHEQTKANR